MPVSFVRSLDGGRDFEAVQTAHIKLAQGETVSRFALAKDYFDSAGNNIKRSANLTLNAVLIPPIALVSLVPLMLVPFAGLVAIPVLEIAMAIAAASPRAAAIDAGDAAIDLAHAARTLITGRG